MKRLILLCLVLISVGLPSGSAQVLRTVRLYDAFTAIDGSREKVRDVKELKRTPLFDNAPFLRLRPGDALVEAKLDPEGQMGKGYPDLNRTDIYLRSGGEYYRLWTKKEDDKLLLSPAFHGGGYCLLFDWECNLATAEALRDLLPAYYFAPITEEKYRAATAAIRKEFPEIEIGHEAASPELGEPRILYIPGQKLVEFTGMRYDPFHNCFYRTCARIGPSVCTVEGTVLIQGPRHVERREFERVDIRGVNGSPGQDVPPEKAKVRRAEYDKMVRFQTLVRAILSEKPL